MPRGQSPGIWPSQHPKCMGLLYRALAEVRVDPSEMDEAGISLSGLSSGHGRGGDKAHPTAAGWKAPRCLCKLVFWGFQPSPAAGSPAAAPLNCARGLVFTRGSKHTEHPFGCHCSAGGWELPAWGHGRLPSERGLLLPLPVRPAAQEQERRDRCCLQPLLGQSIPHDNTPLQTHRG